jgi:hypothetical protein
MKTIEKKTPEALECTHILGTTAEQVVVKWSNARPGGILPSNARLYRGNCKSNARGLMIVVGFDSYINRGYVLAKAYISQRKESVF